jgi:hypothetical protein
MTRLGDIRDAIAAPSTASGISVPRPLTRALAGGRRGELVELPHLGKAWVELPGALAWEEAQAAARAEMTAAGLDLSMTTAELFEMKLARHTLARAVRHPDQHAEPFGTLAEWGEIDPDVINACWHAYGDVRERLDPVAVAVTPEETAAIDSAIRKKNGLLLRSFGIAKLSAFLLSTEDQPPTSPPPSSPSTES